MREHSSLRPPKALYQVLLQPLFGDDEISYAGGAATATLAPSREMLQPLSRLAKSLNFDPVPGILTIPNMEAARQD
jgi:hypothetical protein